MLYTALKHLHMTAIAVSFLLFTFRFILRMANSGLANKKWLKIVPHIIDTLLLASAIGLMIMIAQYPLVHTWLTVKVVCVVGYIVMGVICFKQKAKHIMMLSYLGAVFFIALAGKIAVTKTVPFLG